MIHDPNYSEVKLTSVFVFSHRLINAVGRDYGSAPPVQDSDQADELMAESETLAFTPKMLLERERELLGASSLHQAELSGIHQTDSKQDDEPAEDGHIDTLASSIHAIHRPLEHLTSTSREPASPEVSRSSPDKTIAVCHAPNLPHHYDEGCSDEPRSESESEHDDAFESGRPQRRRSQLTASRLRQLDETLGSSSQAHVHPERRGASAASSVEDVQQPQEGHHHVQRSMSRSERLAILAAKLQEIFGHSEQEEIVAGKCIWIAL